MDEVKYMVRKVTTVHKMCTMCQGTGKSKDGKPCLFCDNGAAGHQHITEVELTQALLALGLIKPKQ